MNCATVRETFAELIDDGLPAGHEAEIRSHLDACPACRREWREYRATVNAVQGLGLESPSAGFAARVRGRIEAPPWWRRAARWLVFPLPVKLPLHAAALVVLGVAGVWLFEQSAEVKRSVKLMPEIAGPAHSVAEPRGKPEEKIALPSPTAPSGAVTQVPASPPQTPMPAPSAAQPQRAPALSEQQIAAEPRQEAEIKSAPLTPSAPPGPVFQEPAPPAQPAPALSPNQERPAADADALGRSQSPAGILQRSDAAAKLGSAADTAVAVQKQVGPIVAPAPAASPPTVVEQPAPLGASRARSALQATAPAADLFTTGKDAWAARDFGRAAASLREFLTRAPQDPRAPEARFLLAEAYRADGRFADAVGAYTEFLRQSPNDERTPAAMFGLAESRISLGDRAGCDLLGEILTRYPNVPEAAPARTFLSSHCP